MAKQNCWEITNCGREEGGSKVEELGVCKASTTTALDGENSGTNGGRICWAISGTLCGGEIQGEHAKKMDNCIMCDVYNTILKEEKSFVMYPDSLERANCWDYLQCGREPNGSKVNEMGVCPAAVDASVSGMNKGTNGGRICWAIAGTFCGGEVQAEFANKFVDCITCSFYKKVLNEEADFVIHPVG